MSTIRTFNVEAGLPTLDEARRLVIEEIKRAKREGTKVLKVILSGKVRQLSDLTRFTGLMSALSGYCLPQ